MAKRPVSEADKRYKQKRTEDIKSREEAQREMDEAVPTPSQEEIDQAMMNMAAGRGAVVDADLPPEVEKPVPAAPPRAASADVGAATYKNRADKTT